jgi:hypothetical protein
MLPAGNKPATEREARRLARAKRAKVSRPDNAGDGSENDPPKPQGAESQASGGESEQQEAECANSQTGEDSEQPSPPSPAPDSIVAGPSIREAAVIIEEDSAEPEEHPRVRSLTEIEQEELGKIQLPEVTLEQVVAAIDSAEADAERLGLQYIGQAVLAFQVAGRKLQAFARQKELKGEV